jgi:hypothetical protein
MIENDTIKLLRECDAGVKMGVSSIDDVIDYVSSPELKELLNACKDEHEKLNHEMQQLLEKYDDDGKEPNPIAKGMSWMKTNVKMGMDHCDETIADLMVDGCDMGIKSLQRYLNQYPSADKSAKDICNRLISIEDELRRKLYKYL